MGQLFRKFDGCVRYLCTPSLLNMKRISDVLDSAVHKKLYLYRNN